MPQHVRRVRRRRMAFGATCVTSFVLGLWVLCLVLSRDGIGGFEWGFVIGYILTMPYTVIGFWNALIGLWLRHRRPDVLAAMPGVAELSPEAPLEPPRVDTAIVMTLRNEAPGPVFERLRRMRDSLAATGHAARFTFVILSDSDRLDIVAEERQAMAVFDETHPADQPAPFYRRREDNTGYKAGNIADFLDTHGGAYRYFLPLDADSLMDGPAVVRLVAMMEKHPAIGIVQPLVVGMPSSSGFTRVFQFGMRHAMRAFTAGAAWWTADCGAYWGHNALIRTAPFIRHCRLPRMPGNSPLGGDILSHDQLEAAFMRRAGYEVRVVPIETASYEINPPTLLDFIRRELRWCQGNMQYLRLLSTPGLMPVSRFQLGQAVGMYIAPAAWIGMTLAACIGGLAGGFSLGHLSLGLVLFFVIFGLAIAPRLIGAIDVSFSTERCRAYGGLRRFWLSVLLDLLISIVMAPIVAFSVTVFLGGLVFGRRVVWSSQNRDRIGVAWRDALARLAPHTVFGVIIGMLFWISGGLASALWILPIASGLALAVPFTVLSAWPGLGPRMARHRLCEIPEESQRPKILME